MRIFILALGTRGDLELFLTLGSELRRRGHDVLLGSSAFYEARVRQSPVAFTPVAGGTHAEMLSALDSLATIPDRRERTYLFFQRWLQPQIQECIPAVTSLAAGSDYFISNLKIVLSRGGEVVPGVAVTYDPPGDLAELAQYRTQEHGARIMDLVAMSRALIDPEQVWGAAYRFTGFWAENERSDWSPPEDFASFLEAGPPPVVITMGSMVMFDADRLARLAAEALHLAGVRGVLVRGWSEVALGPSAAGPLYCVAEVPYGWLFPRASCIIHHGGCGTIAAVLQAGKVSIVLPQITAQELFARLLAREHLATAILDVATLTPAALAVAITRSLHDQEARQSARKWQRISSGERGVQAAADLIGAHACEVGLAEARPKA